MKIRTKLTVMGHNTQIIFSGDVNYVEIPYNFISKSLSSLLDLKLKRNRRYHIIRIGISRDIIKGNDQDDYVILPIHDEDFIFIGYLTVTGFTEY